MPPARQARRAQQPLAFPPQVPAAREVREARRSQPVQEWRSRRRAQPPQRLERRSTPPRAPRQPRALAMARASAAPRGGGAPYAHPSIRAPALLQAPRPSSWRGPWRPPASLPAPPWPRQRHCRAGGSSRPSMATPQTCGRARAFRVPSGHARAKSGRPSRASGGCARRHPSREAWTTLRRSRCRTRPPDHSPEASSNCLPRAATRPRSRALREFLSPTPRRRYRSPPSRPARQWRPVRTP